MSNIPQIIIDTDPGQDDAAAILMALGLDKLNEIKLLALTCVAGNVPLHYTQKNARIICDWAQRSDIPVYAGAKKPLLKPLFTAEEVHGKTGLDGTKLHEPNTVLQEKNAAIFLAETLANASKNSITLCPIGPLTNLALAFSLNPQCIQGIKEIVIMGGTFFEAGNVTPNADFNFFVDPVAAQIVLQSGANIRIVPLDVTHKACITNERMEALRQLPNQNGKRFADILQSYERFDIQQFGLEGGPLHDPCAIAAAIRPEFFNQKSLYVEVDTSSGICEGATALDWHGKSGKTPNALWCYHIDDKSFFDYFTHAISALP
ncbi:MAG: nucleoside hydrolase [Neisseriaceae bacterium]|nr:nucleoside hydrolase [Neisseriaceae bacterium]